MTKIDDAALAIAVKKLRRLRIEDVYGRKERPAETVASALDRAYRDLGSVEAVEYILRHGVKYYLQALSK